MEYMRKKLFNKKKKIYLSLTFTALFNCSALSSPSASVLLMIQSIREAVYCFLFDSLTVSCTVAFVWLFFQYFYFFVEFYFHVPGCLPNCIQVFAISCISFGLFVYSLNPCRSLFMSSLNALNMLVTILLSYLSGILSKSLPFPAITVRLISFGRVILSWLFMLLVVLHCYLLIWS